MSDTFSGNGLTFENIVNVVCYQKDFEAFLLDVQHGYRISRALGEDPGDELLIKSRCMDEVIALMGKLDEAREEYLEKKRQEEKERLEKNTKEQNNQ